MGAQDRSPGTARRQHSKKKLEEQEERTKRGGCKTSQMTTLPKRGSGPPSYGTFSTPLRCQRSVFPVSIFTTEQTRSSFGGVQKFSGERALWYVFFPPIRDSDGDSESIFRNSTLDYCVSTLFLLLVAEYLAIPGPRFWESCDSRFAILCR